jgi:hypothetical protein
MEVHVPILNFSQFLLTYPNCKNSLLNKMISKDLQYIRHRHEKICTPQNDKRDKLHCANYIISINVT